MRVLHVTPSLSQEYGGPTASLLGYALAGAEAGASIAIAAPRPGARDADVFRQNGFDRLELFRGYGRAAFSIAPSLIRWVGRHAPEFDVVHVHGLFNPVSTLAARSAVGRRVPVILRPFGTLSRYTFGYRRAALKRVYFHLLDAGNLRKATALHFTTLAEQREAESILGRKVAAHVIPPALPVSHGPHLPRNPSSHPSAVVVARLHPVKNIESLLDAWPAVLKEEPGATLTVAGGGHKSYGSQLQRRAASLGLDDKVSFSGAISHGERERLLRTSWLSVLPSHHENFGIAVLEALAAGLPVVISPHVQLAPFVSEHHLGIVTESSPVYIAAAIVRVFRDAELRTLAASQGPSLVQEYFAPAVIGQRLLRMYQSAATARQP